MARNNTRRMKKLRDEFFLEGQRQSQDPSLAVRELSFCWLCRSAIDYVAAPGSTPDSHHLDHYQPVSEFPELQEEPDNFRHAHASCNLARGASAPSRGLGTQVPDWW